MEDVNAAIRALVQGDSSLLRQALDEGLNPSWSDGWHTLLMEAIEGDSAEGVELLLSRGADVNACTPYGTALHYAVDCAVQAAESIEAETAVPTEPPLRILEILIRAGADVNAVAPDGTTPLDLAQGRHKEPYNAPAVRLLSSLGAKGSR